MPRATGVRTLLSIAAVALLVTTACSHAPAFKYDDDADVADLKEQFSCSGAALTPLQREACRIIDAFAAGTAFDAWPTSPSDLWFGRAVCKAEMSIPNHRNFAYAQLRPGAGRPPFGPQVDASRVLPYQLSLSIGADEARPEIAAPAREALERLFKAAEQGTEPDLSGLPDLQRASFGALQKSMREPMSGGELLAASTGASVLGAPVASVDRTDPAAMDYLRRQGDRMLLVRPSKLTSTKTVPPQQRLPCVAELWKIAPKARGPGN